MSENLGGAFHADVHVFPFEGRFEPEHSRIVRVAHAK